VGAFNVLSKADRALAAYIISEEAGTEEDTFAGKRAPDAPNPPYTVCFSEDGSSDHQPTYKVKARIDIYTNCAPEKHEDTEAMKLDSDERVSATWDAFHLEADKGQGGHYLADAITEAARSAGGDLLDFTVTDVIVGRMEQGSAGKEGMWLDSLNMELVCVPHNLDS
jgi:hypothetical protein